MLPGLISGAADMKGGVFVSDDSVKTIHYTSILDNYVIQIVLIDIKLNVK